jgi:hypothetical protein
LQYADKDAADLYALFKDNIGDLGYNRLLVDSEATLSEIRTSFGKDLQQNIESDDAFFFFFSGHGTTAEDEDGTSYSHYLIPFDATRDITNSCISIDYLKDVFDNLEYGDDSSPAHDTKTADENPAGQDGKKDKLKGSVDDDRG